MIQRSPGHRTKFPEPPMDLEAAKLDLERAKHKASVRLGLLTVFATLSVALITTWSQKQSLRDQLLAAQANLPQNDKQRAAQEQSLKDQLESVQARLLGKERQWTVREQSLKDQLELVQASLLEKEKQWRAQEQSLKDELAVAQSNLKKEERPSGRDSSRPPISTNLQPPSNRPGVPASDELAIRPVQAGDFRFEVRGCIRSVTRIRCSGTVTNIGPSPQGLYLRWNECFAQDNFHNQVTLTSDAFKVGDGTGKPLQPDLPVAFYVVLDDEKQETTKLTVGLAIAGSKFPLPMEQTMMALMKNIPIVVK